MDALAAALIVALVLTLLMALAAVVALLVGLRRLERRNRVSPDVPSPAPSSWGAGHPSAPARLHRRLRSAVAASRAACATAPSAPRLAELTAELEAEAVALDGQIVVVAHLPARSRRVPLAGLAARVRQVEQVASQVSLLAVRAQAPMVAAGQASALDELARQLDLLEQARTEVADIEAAAGVARPSPYADPGS
ncbi:MAG TPA: hypothetical protein VEW93_14650 [Acidimicrobiales bacterium]|nr:hypothetical protein [Acidimicrobiales bacterium]